MAMDCTTALVPCLNGNDMSDEKDKRQTAKPWGGRFSETTETFVEHFTASVDFDQKLYQEDIDGSLAHAKMLNKVGILTSEELDQIVTGLESIRQSISSGNFNWSVELEDVHMNI